MTFGRKLSICLHELQQRFDGGGDSGAFASGYRLVIDLD